MFKNLICSALTSLILVCLLSSCNTEKRSAKTTTPVVEAPIEEKELTIEEEVEQEQIGAAQLDYTDLDESGKGIYGRQINDSFHEKLNAIKADADPIHKGTLKIICCIDQSGSIMMARPDIQNTTMTDLTLQRKVGKMLIDERFQAKYTAPERQCGIVVIEF